MVEVSVVLGNSLYQLNGRYKGEKCLKVVAMIVLQFFEGELSGGRNGLAKNAWLL